MWFCCTIKIFNAFDYKSVSVFFRNIVFPSHLESKNTTELAKSVRKYMLLCFIVYLYVREVYSHIAQLIRWTPSNRCGFHLQHCSVLVFIYSIALCHN